MRGEAGGGIRLCALSASDADAITRFCSDWELAKTTGRLPYPYERRHAEAFLAEALAPGRKARAVSRAIRLGDDLIGVTGWTAVKDGVVADFGYWLGRPYWGRGFGSRAARLAIGVIFDDPQVREVGASVFQDNPASARVLVKCGFVQIGEGMGESAARGGEHPLWRFVLSRQQRARREGEAA